VAQRVFLLSPASLSGKRAQLLLSRDAGFELATRVRREGAPLGEVFSFLSSLYFRGKLAYAQRFARPPARCPGVFVITTNLGLVEPGTATTLADLRGFARVPIDLRDGALALRERVPARTQIVLLGSIATPKYVDPLREVFGSALVFPPEFVGRGDMSRGGLLLRAARAGEELGYQPIDACERRGRRPPRRAPPTRQAF
jgi:hypothetical protein